MSLTCDKCRRANPQDAVYCYFDGFALNGHGGRNAGPVAVGAQQFNNPFVFPSGRTCRSFDEMATAIQEEWDAAKELLQQDFFKGFFGGMGRADLARAADEARKFGDPDRGLDQLLDKLPSQVLKDPKLRVEPQEINLGQIQGGGDRDIELELENQGGRLLYGKVMSVDTPWLSLGQGQGIKEKIFQFTHSAKIVVHVKPAKLRASAKGAEGKLVIDSNGGPPVTIKVRAEVNVKPFPGSGPLAGARSPRQVAEKAKANPKEAAKVFEAGEVQAWYKMNGWNYPVQGPTSSGLSAIQQFFEALGLTPPPKVDINHRSVSLSAEPGAQNVRFTLEVKTDEKKPVYAHGTSNQPWLEVSRAKLNGRSATINLVVPVVPDRPGETLTAKVAVQSNGNQRFVVPVTLQIGGAFNFAGDAPAVIPLDEPPKAGLKQAAVAAAPVAALDFSSSPQGLPEPVFTPRMRRSGGPHWLVAAALATALAILVLLDLLRKKEEEEVPIAQVPITTSNWQPMIRGMRPTLAVGFTESTERSGVVPGRWGLTTLDFRDPNNDKEFKRLTFDKNGGTNNTVIRIDNHEYVFGRSSYRMVKLHKQKEVIPDRYWTKLIEFNAHFIHVTQHILLVPGPPKVEENAKGEKIEVSTLDNCLVYYEIKNVNKSNIKVTVGARVLLDTYIGGNDGVPFTIPGRPGFMSTLADIPDKDIPDFIEAVERPDDAKDPGTVARVGLRGIKVPWVDLIESPNRLVICQQPENPEVKWDWGEFAPISTPMKKDSCVVMYWKELPLDRNETRTVGFTYGLNALKIEGGGDTGGTGLALSVPGGVLRNSPFTVTCYVYNAREGQEVKLNLPAGMSVEGGNTRKIPAAGKRVKVEWKVTGSELGPFKISAESDKATSEKRIAVRADGIF